MPSWHTADVITSVAEFLRELQVQEAERLAGADITHAPTIDDTYEGLSKDILGRAIPSSLGLRLANGFVTDGVGGLSGQIDCMLVKARGRAFHTRTASSGMSKTSLPF